MVEFVLFLWSLAMFNKWLKHCEILFLSANKDTLYFKAYLLIANHLEPLCLMLLLTKLLFTLFYQSSLCSTNGTYHTITLPIVDVHRCNLSLCYVSWHRFSCWKGNWHFSRGATVRKWPGCSKRFQCLHGELRINCWWDWWGGRERISSCKPGWS